MAPGRHPAPPGSLSHTRQAGRLHPHRHQPTTPALAPGQLIAGFPQIFADIRCDQPGTRFVNSPHRPAALQRSAGAARVYIAGEMRFLGNYIID